TNFRPRLPSRRNRQQAPRILGMAAAVAARQQARIEGGLYALSADDLEGRADLPILVQVDDVEPLSAALRRLPAPAAAVAVAVEAPVFGRRSSRESRRPCPSAGGP